MATEPLPYDGDPPDGTPRWLEGGLRGHTLPFVESYYPQILEWAKSCLRQLTLSGIDPEDIAQDVIRRFLEMPEWTYQPQAKARFRGYLRQTVRNRILDELKKRRRHPGDFAAGGEGAALLAAVEASIDEIAERFDTQRRRDQDQLREACERVQHGVGPHRWQAFYQTVVEKKKGVQVARTLGMTPSAVYSARGDVARALREELRRLGYTADPNEPTDHDA